jgi:hypothetical protein
MRDPATKRPRTRGHIDLGTTLADQDQAECARRSARTRSAPARQLRIASLPGDRELARAVGRPEPAVGTSADVAGVLRVLGLAPFAVSALQIVDSVATWWILDILLRPDRMLRRRHLRSGRQVRRLERAPATWDLCARSTGGLGPPVRAPWRIRAPNAFPNVPSLGSPVDSNDLGVEQATLAL